jgi:hypothetical protein
MSLYIWVMFNIHVGIFYCLGRALLALLTKQISPIPYKLHTYYVFIYLGNV